MTAGAECCGDFRAALHNAGLTPGEVIADGVLHRCPTADKPAAKDGWFVLFSDPPAGAFGNWRTGEKHTWFNGNRDEMDAETRRRLHERVEKARQERDAKNSQKHADAAEKAGEILKGLPEATPENPYLARKGVRPCPGLKADGETLVVPVFGPDGRTASLQWIEPGGAKKFMPGGRIAGGYFPINKGGDGALIVSEGIATGLTINAADPAAVVLVGFNAGNLKAVAEMARRRHPDRLIIIAGDNDAETEALTGANPGRAAAEAAARAVNGKVTLPVFAAGKTGSDFNDLAASEGIGEVKRQLAAWSEPRKPGPADPAGDADPSAWGEPQDLYAVDEPLPYPLGGLPPIIREAVEEVVAFTQCPPAMVAASALSALSTAVQGHIDVERADRLTGPVSLFFLSVADSGERKSTCDLLFTRAIREYQKREEEKAAPAVAEYCSRHAAWEAKRAAILESIKRETKGDKSTYLLENKLIQLQATQPEAPHYPHILLLDETPESLGTKLAKQWPAVAILSPEAGLVLGGHGMGKESAMRNMTLLNVLWDGASIEVGRKTSGSYRVEDARLTLGLQVQEAALRSFFERSEGLSRGVGFMARFLFSWPKTTMGGRMFQEPPDQFPKLERYLRRISDILDRPLRLTDRCGVAPETIGFSPAAKAAWILFHDAVETALGPDGEFHEVRDVAAKAADNLARLSALFHFLEGRPAPITNEAVDLAASVVAWHLTEALRLFNSVILTPELVAAGILDRWLVSYCRRHGVGEVPTTVVMKSGPGALRSKDPLYSAVKALAEFNRARMVKGDGKRRNIAVNPSLLR